MQKYYKISIRFVFTLTSSLLILYLLYIPFQQKIENNNANDLPAFLNISTKFKPVPKATMMDFKADFDIHSSTLMISKEISEKDKIHTANTLNELEIEYSNISVLKEVMIKGSSSFDFIFPDKSNSDGSYNVPKTIHFVWTGKPIEEKYVKNIKTFVMNKDYEIILWTDGNSLEYLQKPEGFKVKNLSSLELINSYAINDEKNLGGKSDIYRLEVVYQFGGIYLDTDSVCLKKFPKILEYSFVSHIFGPWNNIINSVYGFPKHSGFLKFALETMKMNWLRQGYLDQVVPGRTGPTFLTTMFVHYNDSNIKMIHQNYLTMKSNKSILYQTYDASWIDY